MKPLETVLNKIKWKDFFIIKDISKGVKAKGSRSVNYSQYFRKLWYILECVGEEFPCYYVTTSSRNIYILSVLIKRGAKQERKKSKKERKSERWPNSKFKYFHVLKEAFNHKIDQSYLPPVQRITKTTTEKITKLFIVENIFSCLWFRPPCVPQNSKVVCLYLVRSCRTFFCSPNKWWVLAFYSFVVLNTNQWYSILPPNVFRAYRTPLVVKYFNISLILISRAFYVPLTKPYPV